MKRQHKNCFLAMLLSLFIFESIAQTTSPLSKLGIGDIRSQVFSANRGMGEIAAGYTSAIQINKVNPASYADINFTTFEVGAGLDARNFGIKDSSYSALAGAFSHFSMAMPLLRGKLGMSLGVLPYANLNYNFSQTSVDTARFYSGKGGLYEAYIGFGGKYKGFSLGINGSYIFGSYNYYRGFLFNDTILNFNIQNNNKVTASSFKYNIGAQYKVILKKKNQENKLKTDIGLILGVCGSSGVPLSVKSTTNWERFFYYNAGTATQVYVADTPLLYASVKNKIKMPYDISIGGTVGNENWWLLGADFKYTGWSQYANPIKNDVLKDSWRIAAGISYLPNYESKAYLSRMTYRAGIYGGATPYTINGSSVNEIGGTVGLSLPFPFKKENRIWPENGFARLLLNTDIGKRSASNNTISETYYRFTVGVTFNSQWFIKRKFD